MRWMIPDKNIPKAIYTAVILVALIYFIIALGSVIAIPAEDLIKNKEYALASGAEDIMGHWGRDLVILGCDTGNLLCHKWHNVWFISTNGQYCR